MTKIITKSDEQRLVWFSRIMEEYYTQLIDFARIITQSSEISEEIVEDVFIKMWKRDEEVSQIENLRAYLFKAVRNTALNYLKKESRSLEVYLDELPPLRISCNHADPEETLISKELNEAICRAVDGLPAKCKIIYKMAREDGLKHREIAELLGISEKTVENQISIALKKIAGILSRENNGNLNLRNGNNAN
ncbi:MAG: RNA polymerase sigma-70 factor [Bacteroidota bacterium]